MTELTFTLSPRMLVVGGLALLVVVAVSVVWFVRHQRMLAERAYLMREAVRNHDFTFHLSERGLFPGERAMQEALNDLGGDISRMVAENEVESWQKLMRVLTHEIMNTTAPICSISQSYLDHPAIKDSPFEEGIRAIRDTGSALSAFTGSFRKLTQLQPPVICRVQVQAFAEKMRALCPALSWQIDDISPSAVMLADEGMLLQVVTNLSRNAQEAGASVMALHWTGTQLLVSNNGAPIPTSVCRNIFVPFFTTKTGGSGIGLALSRQLMINQGGNLSLQETPQPGWHVTFAVEGHIKEEGRV